MKRNDQTFQEMVSRIKSGELTRKQAATAYGIEYGTLCVWLGRSGLNAETVAKGPLAHRRGAAHGAATNWPVLSPETSAALDAALARVLAGETTAQGESKADPRIKLTTLTQRVRSARREMEPVAAPTPAPTLPKSDVSADYDLIVSILADPKRLPRLAALARIAAI